MLKKIIIFITVLIFAITTYCQTAMDYYNLAEQAEKEYRYNDAIEYYKHAGNLLKEAGRKGDYAIMLNNIGFLYKGLGQYDKAIENYRKALTIDEELGKKGDIARDLNEIGGVYYSWGQYDKAIENFMKTLAIDEELDRKGNIATDLNNIGMVYKFWGQYDKAIECYGKALAIAEELGQQGSAATLLNNIGMVYQSWGQYDKAIENFRKALAIFEELGQQGSVATLLNNIGIVYDSWGQYDKAIENFRKALAIIEELGQQEYVATSLNNIGVMYRAWGQYDKSIENLRKALAIDEELGRKGEIARDLNNIGMVYHSWGQYDKAIENYRKALTINEELGQKDMIAIGLNNIGMVYKSWGQYDKAIENFRKALAICEELGEQRSVATLLTNIGALYFRLKKYEQAEVNFIKSIAIKERLRLTAEGAVRRDYLASQIHTYQYLISTYIRSNKPALAFNTKEFSAAKYLIEQMGKKLKEKDILFEGIKNYQKKLSNNTAIINYSNINWYKSAQIVADKNNIYAIEVSKEDLISNINIKYKNEISNALENLRGFKIKGKDDLETLGEKVDDDLDEIINYYRLLLSKSNLSPKEEETIQYIGKELYKFLFGSIQEKLKEKDELIIIPDGVLAFLPFETLIMPDGRFLIEKYHIKYTQSLTVSDIIERRNYIENRKPLLAFGGAVYDEISYETDIIIAEKQLENLKNETLLALSRGQSTRKAYTSLGLAEWDNLPGTLTEVNAIQYLIEGSEIYTGKSVNESTVKSLSEKGDLKEYKVLHFATHGLVVPEIPELSALVLSLSKEEENNEDGYLTMKEIAELDINADFVNLSACETGLGKIYGGEGVVGLTQSFLIAGANGLSVSLWQVSDESTMKFMIGVYKLVQEKGLSYDKAITEMKRAFISGAIRTDKYDIKRGFKLLETESDIKKPNKYSIPFYWAPFVYYGK